MTDERPNNEATSDENVSRVYRELATERAPDNLNAAVLQEAQRAARPRYARARAWTRPLAWAATVVLTVGIVLELTKVPELDDAAYELNAPHLQRAETDADAVMDAPLEEAEEEVPASVAPARASNVTPAAPDKTSFRKTVTTQLPAEPEREQRKNETGKGLPSSVPEQFAPVAADELQRQHKDELQHSDDKEALAAELAPERARSPVAAVEAGRPEARADSLMQVTGFAEEGEASVCPEEAIQTPETWLECIEELDQAGRTDIAAEQRRQLAEAFPGFDTP